ncbi:30S ribosomal protein S27ae [Thermogymnomonas acidicola]|uniref:30S ribosomal protein S27ae n=1 Tax=Thermogymnomonas acidicola TaxID=399579 RepID=UPI0009465B50|nr:30S ribosomal protein S27ae [Thermogymnomonas acidicola]
MQKRELYKLEGGEKVVRERRYCPPRCGPPGVFLAEHEDRLSCGRCGYTEFKKKQTGKEEKKGGR